MKQWVPNAGTSKVPPIDGRDDPVGTKHFDPKKALARQGLQLTAKVDPYHDPANGEFTSPGGATAGEEAQQRVDRLREMVGRTMGTVDLSTAERNAVSSYAGNKFYRKLNSALRSDPSTLTDDQKQIVSNLDSAIAKGSLPQDLTLYRGVSDWQKVLGTKTSDALIGKSFQDSGFVSTSLFNTNIGMYFRQGGTKNAVIEIQAPKGTPTTVGGGLPDAEFILARGTTFKITGVSTNTVQTYRGPMKLLHISVTPSTVSKQSLDKVLQSVDQPEENQFIWEPGMVSILVNKAEGAIDGPAASWQKLPQQKELTQHRKTPKPLMGWKNFTPMRLAKDGEDDMPITDVRDGAGRPQWMSSPNGGGQDPVYRSQKPDGNKDTLFSQNVNQNPKPVKVISDDSYLIW